MDFSNFSNIELLNKLVELESERENGWERSWEEINAEIEIVKSEILSRMN